MAEFHFDEIIKVVKIDSQVVYDKVSRINAKSEDGDFYLELDIHSELYPMLPREKYRMVISNSILMDGSAVPGYISEEQKSLADKFEYVMHGLLYNMSEADDSNISIYISFGGLQLMLKGNPLKMRKFNIDQKLFLLLRKV
ncbi:DNA-directed RNA polymerases II, IV and V subunit 8B-like [Andrographis paniculata]|uniref:DNA-directed RNA polymerases II, IV and V subunit 8B-like n=1 Tax=Andrographis paniculata TaxID=175694 RepID=UPI0021E72BD2|nr:DNA-directed RNA polymerases II, IV and V subunit 8B-like [Andrographis paniculata]XP_051144232.1 DNA-directed RNA polymerases II, IV and V subunit 8B-like [Andrographis paniculata]